MITEELEEKLKITKDTCIHCSTLKLAKQVLDIFHKTGLKWIDEKYYIVYTNWDSWKENTVYYPFEGGFTSLGLAHLTGNKIISAEKFIDLHTEVEEFDLENYIPKGELEGFPKEIISRMLNYQEEQGYPRNVSVFEEDRYSGIKNNGFDWGNTKEGWIFWSQVISLRNFDIFFTRYPKQDNQDNSQGFDLENYIPKGELEGFPKEIISKMLDCQEEQLGKRDISVFEKYRTAGEARKGFVWSFTKEGRNFWNEVIRYKNFNLFFKRYPKKQEYQESKTAKHVKVGDNAILSEATSTQSSVEINITEDDSQLFRVGDKVYDILLGKIGIVKNIILNDVSVFPIEVYYENYGRFLYTHEGRFSSKDKYPRLLHYRDDYNYIVIDFSNLPKRQDKRWRAKKRRDVLYYYLKL